MVAHLELVLELPMRPSTVSTTFGGCSCIVEVHGSFRSPLLPAKFGVHLQHATGLADQLLCISEAVIELDYKLP